MNKMLPIEHTPSQRASRIIMLSAARRLNYDHRSLASALEAYSPEELAWALAGIIQQGDLEE